MKILCLHNRKGGVGKTALAVQLSYDLQSRGYRTLCLEFDGQRNASQAFARGGIAALAPFTSLAVFQAKAALVPDGNLIVVPAHEVMDRLFEGGAGEYNGFINHLADWFRGVDERFDVCVIDNAPGEDIRWGAAMATADAVLIPTTLRQETLEGVESFLNHPEYGFKRMKGGRAKGPNGPALKAVNPDLKLLGILPNLVMRSALEAQALDWLTTHYPTLLMTLPRGAPAVLKHRLIIPFAQMRGVFIGSLNTQEAREVWAEMKPIFDEIVRQIDLPIPTPACLGLRDGQL